MNIFIKMTFFILFNVYLIHATDFSKLENYIKARVTQTPVENMDYKCAFQHQVFLQTQWQNLPSSELKQMAKKLLLQKPKRQFKMVSPSGHFTLHYDLTGIHAVPPKDSLGNGIPDYIDSAAAILDHVWQVEIDQMGFRPPPDSTGNPVQSYPVYFSSMVYYGLTNFDINEDIPSLPGQNYVSYLELHKNYQDSRFASKGLKGLKVTAAHEFHHAIQLGYQFRWHYENGYAVYPDLFFLEMSSTFMEDYVYDDINDYVQYVNRLIPNLEQKSFDAADGNTEYANCLFLHLLTQKFGASIFLNIWENIISYPALEAIDLTLQDYQSSFAEMYNQYAGWFYFTGDNSRSGSFFKDASLFRQLYVTHYDKWLEDPLPSLHMRFNLLSLEKSGVYLAQMSSNQAGGKLNHIPNGEKVLNPVDFKKSQIFSQQSDQPLVVVITNSTEHNLTHLQYHIKLAPISVKNNPIKISTHGENGVTFLYLPDNAQLIIFNLLGQKIISLHTNHGSQILWNLKNSQGRTVPSGIYFYRVKAKGLNFTGKITVVR